jgi:hypothetical protein
MDDFERTLDKFKVPHGEQAELKELVNSTGGISWSEEWSSARAV